MEKRIDPDAEATLDGTTHRRARTAALSDGWRAWVSTQGPWLKLVLAAAVSVLLLIPSLMWLGTSENAGSEIAAAALSVGITLATAAIAFSGDYWTYRQKARQAAKVERMSSTDTVRLGLMHIDHVKVVASCGYRLPWSHRIDLEFDTLRPPSLSTDASSACEAELINALVSVAREKQRTLFDAQIVSADAAYYQVISRDQVRRPRIVIEPSVSTYFRAAIVSTAADTMRDPANQEPFNTPCWDQVRESLQESHLTSLADLRDFDRPKIMGVGVVVVTSDRMLVLLRRTRTWAAGSTPLTTVGPAEKSRVPLHVVAEGMLPTDVNPHTQRLDPSITAYRALAEELAVGPSSIDGGVVTRMVATGFFLDTLRWQPQFTYLAEVSVPFEELITLSTSAPDYWETGSLEARNFDDLTSRYFDGNTQPSITDLLMGEDEEYAFASNHAQAAVWFACLYDHGLAHLRNALTRSTAGARQAEG